MVRRSGPRAKSVQQTSAETLDSGLGVRCSPQEGLAKEGQEVLLSW